MLMFKVLPGHEEGRKGAESSFPGTAVQVGKLRHGEAPTD